MLFVIVGFAMVAAKTYYFWCSLQEVRLGLTRRLQNVNGPLFSRNAAERVVVLLAVALLCVRRLL